MPEAMPPTTTGPPHVRDGSSVSDLMGSVVIALVPCLLVGTWNTGRQASAALALLAPDGEPGWRLDLVRWLGLEPHPASWASCLVLGALHVLPLLGAACAATLTWEHVFARIRRRRVGEGAVVTATVLTLLLPPSIAPWQAAVGASFGIVLGKLVFGGTGRNFLNPAVTGLAYLAVAHPAASSGAAPFPGITGHAGTDLFARAAASGSAALQESGLTWLDAVLGAAPGRIGETSVVACLLGATWLVHRRAACWRVMVAVLLGAGLTAAGGSLARAAAGSGGVPALPWHWHLIHGGLAFTAAFVATDPVSGASTRGGRWLAGLLVGTLVVVLRQGDPHHPDAVVAAVLMTNVATPLIDHLLVRRNVRRRARRGEGRDD